MSERLSITTLSLIRIDHPASSGILLGYSRSWRAFAPIAGGYMITVSDLEEIESSCGAVMLEVPRHLLHGLRVDGIKVLGESEKALQISLADAIVNFETISSPQTIQGKAIQVADAKFWTAGSAKERLIQRFSNRELGISPAQSQKIELTEELGFHCDDSYGVATHSLLSSGISVDDYGGVTRRSEWSRSRGADTTYLDLTTEARFEPALLELIAESARYRRDRFSSPDLAIVAVDEDEIRAEAVRRKPGEWSISPTVSAILRQGLSG
jgi:hypothetical protein